MVFDKVFMLGRRSFMYIMQSVSVLELAVGELHNLLKLFIFYLLDKTRVNLNLSLECLKM